MPIAMRTQPRLTTLHRGAGKPGTSQYMDVNMYAYALYGVRSRVMSVLVEAACHGLLHQSQATVFTPINFPGT